MFGDKKSNNINASVTFIRENTPLMLKGLLETGSKYIQASMLSIYKTYNRSGKWKEAIETFKSGYFTKIMIADNPDLFVDLCMEVNKLTKQFKENTNNVISEVDASIDSAHSMTDVYLTAIKFKKIICPSVELDAISSTGIAGDYMSITPVIKVAQEYHTHLNSYLGNNYSNRVQFDKDPTICDAVGNVKSAHIEEPLVLYIDFENILNNFFIHISRSICYVSNLNDKLFEFFLDDKRFNTKMPNLIATFLEDIENNIVISAIITFLAGVTKIQHYSRDLSVNVANKVADLEKSFLSKVFENTSDDDNVIDSLIGVGVAASINDIATLIKVINTGKYTNDATISKVAFATQTMELLDKLANITDNYLKIPVNNGEPKKKASIVSLALAERVNLDDENMSFINNILGKYSKQKELFFRNEEQAYIDDTFFKRNVLISLVKSVLILICHQIIIEYHLVMSSSDASGMNSEKFVNRYNRNISELSYRDRLNYINNTLNRNISNLLSNISSNLSIKSTQFTKPITGLDNSSVRNFDRHTIYFAERKSLILGYNHKNYDYAKKTKYMHNMYWENDADKNDSTLRLKQIYEEFSEKARIDAVAPYNDNNTDVTRELASTNNNFIVSSIISNYYELIGKNRKESRHFYNGVVLKDQINIDRFKLHIKQTDLFSMYNLIIKHVVPIFAHDIPYQNQVMFVEYNKNREDKMPYGVNTTAQASDTMQSKIINFNISKPDITAYELMDQYREKESHTTLPISPDDSPEKVLTDQYNEVKDNISIESTNIFTNPRMMRLNTSILSYMDTVFEPLADKAVYSKEDLRTTAKRKIKFDKFLQRYLAFIDDKV